jgi:rhodanese-related sulfurtransferase
MGWSDSSEFRRRSAEARGRIRAVSPARALERLQSGALLLDVREADEFADGHISGAVQVSAAALPLQAAGILPDRHASVVLYSSSGNRSALAADALQTIGYTQVVSIEGGIRAWRQEAVAPPALALANPRSRFALKGTAL